MPSFDRLEGSQQTQVMIRLRSSLRNKWLLAFFGICMLSPATLLGDGPQTFNTDWVSATWTPCEGVGLTGSARYFYSAQQSLNADGSLAITSVSVYGSSASFSPDDTTLTASIKVLDAGGNTLQSINLQRPTTSVIEPPPGAIETRRLYLPDGTTLSVPAGASLSLSVSAAKTNCSINNSTKTINPFASSS